MTALTQLALFLLLASYLYWFACAIRPSMRAEHAARERRREFNESLTNRKLSR